MITQRCQHCGAPLLSDDHLTIMQRKIYDIVAVGKGEWVSTTDVVDQLYGDKPRTAVEHFDRLNNLKVHVSLMNKRAGRKIIEGDRGAGKRGYRLATGTEGVT